MKNYDTAISPIQIPAIKTMQLRCLTGENGRAGFKEL